MPGVAITFDRYHLVQDLNFALDQVRRSEQQHRSTLKKSRYPWLRNPDKLSQRQRAEVERLSVRHDKTGRAYRIKLAFQELFARLPEEAEEHLRK